MNTVDVLLIHPPYHRRAGSGVIPPIGLAYVASELERHGYEVAVLDCALDCGSQSPAGLDQFKRYLSEKLAGISPRICIGVGPTTTPALKSLHVLANELVKWYDDTPIVYGGPFASMESQSEVFFELLNATAVVRGEGEEVMPQVMKTLERGELGTPLPGVIWNKDQRSPVALVQDVNSLRFPARHLLENKRYRPSLRRDVFDGPITAVYLSRGCPYHCAFCVSPLLRGNRVARRDTAGLFEEMRECKEVLGIKGFIFYDDCLFLKSRKLNEQVQRFCNELRRTVGDVQWEMELRCDAVASLDSGTLAALQEAGCAQINMGIEKASDQHLKDLNKRLAASEVIHACQNAHESAPGIRLAGTFILGGPGETEHDIDELVEFAIDLDLDFAHFYPLEVYPGTPFFEEVNGNRSPVAWAYEMLKDDENFWGEILYETEVLPKKALLDLTMKAYNQFYGRDEWRERFSRRTRPNVQRAGIAVVERWCEDRFHLTSDDVKDLVHELA